MTVAARTGKSRQRRPSPERHPAPEWQVLEEQDDLVKAAWFGDAGTGKTTAMAGLARIGEVLFVNAEGGVKKKPLRQLGIDTTRIHTARVKNWADIDALLWDLRDRFDRDPNVLTGVCVDTITEIEAVLLGITVEEQVTKMSRSHSVDPFEVEPDYVRNAAQMRKLIRGLRDLPCHVGFSAQSRRDQDEEGVVMYRPALTPQMSGLLLASTDIVMATQPVLPRAKTETYWAVTRRVGKYFGKDRLHVLPRRMPNPSFDRVIAYVNGDLSARTDPEVQAFRSSREEE